MPYSHTSYQQFQQLVTSHLNTLIGSQCWLLQTIANGTVAGRQPRAHIATAGGTAHSRLTGCLAPQPHRALPSLCRRSFHEVEPQPGLAMMTPRELSRRVMVPERGVVPYPDLMDNTLVLSDSLVVCSRGSRTFLMAR